MNAGKLKNGASRTLAPLGLEALWRALGDDFRTLDALTLARWLTGRECVPPLGEPLGLLHSSRELFVRTCEKGNVVKGLFDK